MRTEQLFLVDIVESCDAIQQFLASCDRERFLHDEMLKSAVVYRLIIIGEASTHLSQETKSKYPDVPWARAIGLRNFAAHVYLSLDWDVIWGTATTDVPQLRQRIESILAAEYPEEQQ